MLSRTLGSNWDFVFGSKESFSVFISMCNLKSEAVVFLCFCLKIDYTDSFFMVCVCVCVCNEYVWRGGGRVTTDNFFSIHKGSQ